MENKIYKMRYSSIDGYRLNKSYKSKKGALAFIERWVGAQDLIGRRLISDDGIGKVEALNFRFSDLGEPKAEYCIVCDSHPEDWEHSCGYSCSCGKAKWDGIQYLPCCDGCENSRPGCHHDCREFQSIIVKLKASDPDILAWYENFVEEERVARKEASKNCPF